MRRFVVAKAVAESALLRRAEVVLVDGDEFEVRLEGTELFAPNVRLSEVPGQALPEVGDDVWVNFQGQTASWLPLGGSGTGVPGPPGLDGSDGFDGAPGADGVRGSLWFSSSRAPTVADGAPALEHDHWLDTVTGEVYEWLPVAGVYYASYERSY